MRARYCHISDIERRANNVIDANGVTNALNLALKFHASVNRECDNIGHNN